MTSNELPLRSNDQVLGPSDGSYDIVSIYYSPAGLVVDYNEPVDTSKPPKDLLKLIAHDLKHSDYRRSLYGMGILTGAGDAALLVDTVSSGNVVLGGGAILSFSAALLGVSLGLMRAGKRTVRDKTIEDYGLLEKMPERRFVMPRKWLSLLPDTTNEYDETKDVLDSIFDEGMLLSPAVIIDDKFQERIARLEALREALVMAAIEPYNKPKGFTSTQALRSSKFWDAISIETKFTLDELDHRQLIYEYYEDMTNMRDSDPIQRKILFRPASFIGYVAINSPQLLKELVPELYCVSRQSYDYKLAATDRAQPVVDLLRKFKSLMQENMVFTDQL